MKEEIINNNDPRFKPTIQTTIEENTVENLIKMLQTKDPKSRVFLGKQRKGFSYVPLGFMEEIHNTKHGFDPEGIAHQPFLPREHTTIYLTP